MVIAKGSSRLTARLLAQSARATRSSRTSRTWRPAQRRAYASEGGHSSQQSSILSGDLPWAIVSLAVTLPSVYYLMQPQIERYQHPERHGHGGHGGHGGHDEHDEHDEQGDGNDSSEGEGVGEEKGKDQDEGSDEDSKESEKEDDSGSEGGESGSPNTSDDESPENTTYETEGGQNVEGVRFKGPTSGGTKDGEQGDTRKHIPDAKGANKKRIESHYGKTQGEAEDPEQDPKNKDMGATSKPVGDMTTQSGKQEGLSNTDTKHSTDIADDPEKSTKAEGGPETAKLKGTVDPRRPAK